jgi:threonine dehydratase
MAEPSGGATTAAIRAGAIHPDGPTVLVVSGGNAEPSVIDSLEQLVNKTNHDHC